MLEGCPFVQAILLFVRHQFIFSLHLVLGRGLEPPRP